MASKGQKFNSYTNEFRQQVIDDYFNNLGGVKVLAKKYNISYRTIDTWLVKIRKGKPLESQHHLNKGRPKLDENPDYKEKYEILKNYQTFIKAQREKK